MEVNADFKVLKWRLKTKMLHFSGFQCPLSGYKPEKYEYWPCILLRNEKNAKR